MLSSQSRPVIEATLPVVGEHIQKIAARFYEKLFAAHPEHAPRDLFNRGNQANGSQRQALAGSIAAFAVASPRPPGRPVRTAAPGIAHKDAFLEVRPDQYPFVGDHLFAAIADVLGDAVTPEVPPPGTRCTGRWPVP